MACFLAGEVNVSKDILDMNRAPINRVAAQVTGKGVHWDPKKKREAGDSDMPLPLMPMEKLDYQQRKQLAALSGKKFGRMIVIGVAAEQGSKTKPMRFVVRCACGTYTYRRSKSIRNAENSVDCCDHCRHLLYLKRWEIKRRTGKDVTWEDLE